MSAPVSTIQWVDDDIRDQIIDKLLTQPENKVTNPYTLLSLCRFVLTARARTQSGAPQASEYSCATHALRFIGG